MPASAHSLIGLTCRAPIGARPRLILFGHIRPCTPHVRIHVCCSSTHARAHREIATLALTLQCMHGGCAYPGRTPQPCCHRYIARTASRNHTHTHRLCADVHHHRHHHQRGHPVRPTAPPHKVLLTSDNGFGADRTGRLGGDPWGTTTCEFLLPPLSSYLIPELPKFFTWFSVHIRTVIFRVNLIHHPLLKLWTRMYTLKRFFNGSSLLHLY